MKRLALAIAAYVAVFGGLAVWRWHDWTFGTDTGIFTQAARNAFSGFTNAPEGGTHFRFHWSPILATLWPFVDLGRSGLVLQIAQVVLVAAAALPLYGLARAYVTSSRAFAYASLALIYPPLCALAFIEFHELAFYPVIALALVWAAETTRWFWFAVFALLGSLVREDTCLIFVLVGVVFAIVGFVRRGAPTSQTSGLLGGRPREPERLVLAGLALAFVNVAALALYYRVIVPGIGPWEPSSHFYEYPFAHGPLQVVVALATHPAYGRALLSLGRARYLVEALAPLALLPLLSPWSLVAVPGLAIVLLASDSIVWHMGSHYAALWAPWLLLGTLAALVRLRAPGRAYVAIVASSAIFLVAFNPMHLTHFIRAPYDSADAARALATVPTDADVVTHYDWFARIAFERPHATTYFCPSARYAVFDDSFVRDDYPSDYFVREIRPELRRELATGQMRVAATFGRVTVYRRTPSRGATSHRCVHPGDASYTTIAAALAPTP